MESKQKYILGFQQIKKGSLNLVGGKAANLGELFKIDGINVPDGFCVTTEAFKNCIGKNLLFYALLDQLSQLKMEQQDTIAVLCREIRSNIENIVISDDIVKEVQDFLTTFNDNDAFAVRSSATAEDLPNASFAGQQDTWLNIIGKEAILKHIGKCWASLFTERAVIYRMQNGYDHRAVQLAVIIQKMVLPQSSGVLFTANPITGNRKQLSIDASFGLGEALVSGIATADNYNVQNGSIIQKNIATKRLAVYALQGGGTETRKIETGKQKAAALTDEQILALANIGRQIEAHFAFPQDIEWCLVGDSFFIVQRRPITTLFPVPEANDSENHVYISVGHQQMMTDAMKPLGLSLWRITSMHKAGGRLFVDVTPQLCSPASRKALLNAMGQHDPLIKDALTTLIERGDFIKTLPDAKKEPNTVEKGTIVSQQSTTAPDNFADDPSIVTDLIKRSEESLATLKQNIQAKSGSDLFDFILEDIHQLNKRLFEPVSMGAIMAGINASIWVNDKMNEWLGEKNVADTFSQSVPNNITAAMGMALLDIADAIRPYPEVIDYLEQQVKNENILDGLLNFDGGKESKDAIVAFLDKYGMRCTGEIDITRPRWIENPSALVPVILNNIKNSAPGESKRKFEQGLQEALKKKQELLDRLKQLPDGEQKAGETKRMIGLIRNFSGYREYPKYGIVSRYFNYKQALLKEGEKLLKAKVIKEPEDIYYLTYEELHEVVRSQQLDYQKILKRKEEYKINRKLHPPRVITSDGEIIRGAYKRENLPADAIIGLAVSSGLIEGRARVIFNIEDASLEPGDILVTTFTDPGWTPLFVSIKGLVTEVGGLMTHGAVIAREYGLPAVVGVENATQLIKDGQRIRVNGTDGFIEIL